MRNVTSSTRKALAAFAFIVLTMAGFQQLLTVLPAYAAAPPPLV